jgi:hypothetical protein
MSHLNYFAGETRSYLTTQLYQGIWLQLAAMNSHGMEPIATYFCFLN